MERETITFFGTVIEVMLKEFGLKLKKAREANNYSQKGLGLALGLSDKTISAYESGRSYPSLEVLEKLTMVLDRPLEYFLDIPNKRKEISYYAQEILSKQKSLDEDIQTLLKILKQVE